MLSYGDTVVATKELCSDTGEVLASPGEVGKVNSNGGDHLHVEFASGLFIAYPGEIISAA